MVRRWGCSVTVSASCHMYSRKRLQPDPGWFIGLANVVFAAVLSVYARPRAARDERRPLRLGARRFRPARDRRIVETCALRLRRTSAEPHRPPEPAQSRTAPV